LEDKVAAGTNSIVLRQAAVICWVYCREEEACDHEEAAKDEDDEREDPKRARHEVELRVSEALSRSLCRYEDVLAWM